MSTLRRPPRRVQKAKKKRRSKYRRASCKFNRGSFESRIPVMGALATSAAFAIRLPAHSKRRRERSEGKDSARLHEARSPHATNRAETTHADTRTHAPPNTHRHSSMSGRFATYLVEVSSASSSTASPTPLATKRLLTYPPPLSLSLSLCLSPSCGRQPPNRIRTQTLRTTPRSPASCFPHPCSSGLGIRSRTARAPSHPQRRRPPRPRRRRRMMRPRRRFTGSACG